MTNKYLLGIFHWRDHAGQPDAPNPPASLRTLLCRCNHWLAANPDAAATADGRRVMEIKLELEDRLARHGDGARDSERGD